MMGVAVAMGRMELSPKERRFVAEYLKDQNATGAAKRAGYSAKTAQQQGSRLLLKVVVRNAVDAELAKITEGSALTAELVREKVLAMLTFDPRKAYDTVGRVLDLKDIPDELIDSIMSIEEESLAGGVGIRKKIKFVSRLHAAELAAKLLGILKVEVPTGKDGKALPMLTAKIDFSGLTRDELRHLARIRGGHDANAKKS